MLSFSHSIKRRITLGLGLNGFGKGAYYTLTGKTEGFISPSTIPVALVPLIELRKKDGEFGVVLYWIVFHLSIFVYAKDSPRREYIKN